MATILITGGTGLIGTALTRALLSREHQVIILTRNIQNAKNHDQISYAQWDISKQSIDKDVIERADYIIHLAGANVAEKRWTPERKKDIVDSRVKTGQLLVKALEEISNHVKAVVSASAIGWYGPDPQIPNQRPFIETDPFAQDFLGTTCKQWEEAIQPVSDLGKRLVILRTGIVLSKEGGAYPEFKKSFPFRVASILGNGKQVISWIHINDLVRMYIESIENDKLQGVYNAVTPNPVPNKVMITNIVKYKHKWYFPVHVPEIALKIILGELSIEVLKSATVSSRKIENNGFSFLYPAVETAIRELEAS
jgi:uncharacterized protein (TIGR01777 family)